MKWRTQMEMGTCHFYSMEHGLADHIWIPRLWQRTQCSQNNLLQCEWILQCLLLAFGACSPNKFGKTMFSSYSFLLALACWCWICRKDRSLDFDEGKITQDIFTCDQPPTTWSCLRPKSKEQAKQFDYWKRKEF